MTKKRQVRRNNLDDTGVVANARRFVERQADARSRSACKAESDALLDILAPFDIADTLQAAVILYPLVRAKTVDLDEDFDAELIGLTEGLTQLGNFALPVAWQPGEALATSQSDALRKMLLAIVADVRLVLVRIAEQLYRLRQAKDAADDEKQHIAIETREIYAPLASRLGIWQLKWELEDLAFRYLEPQRYKDIAHGLRERRIEREKFIEAVIKELRSALDANDVSAEISGRPKHIYSIWRKMQRKNLPIEQIFDMRAVRIFVSDVRECYAALGLVHNLWPYLPGEFDDYIANPKENDYRSLHTAVIGPGGKTLEIQIRTHEMHRHAELGVAAHWRYKEGGGEAAFDQKIRFLRQLLEPENPDSDLLEQIRDDVFEDRVYAISPKGDVVEMPAGATPLDFAYHVHTLVGHRCRGAKVNGRIVQLTYKINNGDQVEIITGNEPQPSRDWVNPQLGYLASSRSRNKVRNWFRQQDREQNARQGRDILERELSRLSIRDLQHEQIARHLKMRDVESLCVALGAGDITSSAIASAVQNLRGKTVSDTLRTRRANSQKEAGAEQIAVSGVGDLLCNYARCCRPVPPEQIVGYITQARGVSIHRQDCRNFLSLNARSPERIIAVDWGQAENAVYPADLTIRAYDRQGLLRDISSVFADENVSVNNVQTGEDPQHQQVVMEVRLSVSDLPALSRTISRLERLPNVTGVTRANR
ncbi:MAG: bifunctional (p)ppGpp synthetase/guanosine-3',5'-bis(diphosphate) 3'-pyrophosphohydrolase [Woeseia sp.]|nr:bifunctional (p)ppGpp synthetase/guanosine-3',5'-bis(diphosphate) 3'-pyrophosphohydrolase [Woeseia sp.]